ncbi:MAG: polysulfide reductase NrfD [Coriobacteriales bacterium]|jgi:polysulfide reductase chain C|nr:polysulfide reductase NrfD [Coriobacteriales bacterium]
MNKHYWTWPIAFYLFLGGLGGGMLFLAGVFDILYSTGNLGAVQLGAIDSFGSILAPGVFVGIVALGIGTALLVFELGQPKVFLRVFLSATAIIKWGAIMLTIAMFAALIYFTFYLTPILPKGFVLPWQDWLWLRDGARGSMLVFGLGIMLYTGILLSSLKSKPFWNTPALPVLFTVSALSTASALLAATAGLVLTPEFMAGAAGQLYGEALTEFMVEQLHFIDSVLVLAELVVLLTYTLLMLGAGNVVAKNVALGWIKGSNAPLFWGGMIVCGLLLPFLFYQIGGMMATVIAPILVLAAGLLLRFMVIFADDRRSVPGEERYYSRLPKGDEGFLSAWK